MYIFKAKELRLVSETETPAVLLQVYASIKDQVTAFFVEMGITQVTVQPEFHKVRETLIVNDIYLFMTQLRGTIKSFYALYLQMKPHLERTDCLIRCHDEHCSSSQCCENFLEEDISKSEKDAHAISRRYERKEIIPASSTINLEKFTVYKEEIPEECAGDTKLEISTHNPSCESTYRSSEQHKDQSTLDIDSDSSSCKVSDNAIDRVSTTDDSSMGRDVVS